VISLIVAEEHSPLYDLWAEQGARDLSVCHVDFHCDMRGLLIDRQTRRARYVWQRDPYMSRLDSGSFLAHAIMRGMVTSLRWVHDDFGGRKYDDLYCVKYESDFTALPFRLQGRQPWAPLSYAEQTFADWGGPKPGEHLSIDWDGLAFAEYDREQIERLTAAFLACEFHPGVVFLSHSPEYSYSDEGLFEDFIAALEEKFMTTAVRLPPRLHDPLRPTWPWKIYHQLEYLVLRQMRKRGIY